MVLLCHITSKVAEDKDQGLLQEKGGRGFPFLVVMDEDGSVVAKGFGRDVAAFKKASTEASENAKKFKELSKKAAAGDKDAQRELFKLKAKMGKFKTLADAKKALDALKPTDEERKGLEKALVDLEVGEILKGVSPRNKSAHPAAGKKFAAFEKAGKVPTARNNVIYFWYYISAYAEQQKDATLYQKAITGMKTVLKGPRYQQLFSKMEATLQSMKSGGM